MTNQPIKISENCWKHIDEYRSVFYKTTSDPYSDLHREDGPAVEFSNGNKYWYIDNKLHRTYGPAIEYADGYKAWYMNNKCHREDGPAREYANGNKSWYINGKRHREDGPAIEWANGTKEWYYHDQFIDVNSQEEFELYVKNLIFI